MGELRSSTVVPGTLRHRRDHRLPAQAARPNALHDQRVHRRYRDQRGRAPRRRGGGTEGPRGTPDRAPGRFPCPLRASAVRADVWRAARGAPQPPAIAVALPRDQRRGARLRADRRTALLSLHRRHGAGGPGPAGRLRRQRRRGSGGLASQARRHPADDRRRRRLVHDAAAAHRQAKHGAADPPPAGPLRDRTAIAIARATRAAAAELRGATGHAHRRWLGPHPRRDGRHRADRGDHRRGHGDRFDAGALSSRRWGLWPAAGRGVVSGRDAGARRRQRALRSRPRAPGTARYSTCCRRCGPRCQGPTSSTRKPCT